MERSPARPQNQRGCLSPLRAQLSLIRRRSRYERWPPQVPREPDKRGAPGASSLSLPPRRPRPGLGGAGRCRRGAGTACLGLPPSFVSPSGSVPPRQPWGDTRVWLLTRGREQLPALRNRSTFSFFFGGGGNKAGREGGGWGVRGSRCLFPLPRYRRGAAAPAALH